MPKFVSRRSNLRKLRRSFRVESLESRHMLAAADVLISEIMYHPDPTNTGGEFVEIFNNGETSVSLDGWKLAGAIDFTFPAAASIGGNQYLVVHADPAAVEFYGLTNSAGTFSRQLNNSGETIELRSGDGTLIDQVAYDDAAPWSTAADGSGPSLELIDANLDNNQAQNWALGQPYSPGRANDPDVLGVGGDIVISEIMYHPEMRKWVKPRDPFANQPYWHDGDDPAGEYLELYNRGESTVDMAGWRLLDSGGVLFEFSAGMSLESGSYVVVAADAAAIQAKYNITNVIGNFAVDRSLSDNGEPLTLVDASSWLIDWVNYRDSAPWPIAPDQLSVSMELLDASADNSDPANWRTSRAPRPVEPSRPAVGDLFFITTGTPGAANSVSSDGIPPFIGADDIRHSPEKPTSSDTITVTVSNITGQDAVSSVMLNYEVFVAPYQSAATTQSVAMHDDGQNGDAVAGDGQYTAQIAPLASQSLLRYRVTVEDTANRSWTYPDELEPNPNKAAFAYDGENETAMQAYFLILPSSTSSALAADIWTHEYHEATIVIEGVVYDHVGVHLRGRGWRVHPKKSYKIAFNKSELFRGQNRLDLAMHFSTMQNMTHNLFYSVGAPTMGSEPIRLYRNGSLFGLMLAQESPNIRWLSATGMDPNGEVFKASAAPNYSSSGFTGNIMADLDHFDDPTVYPEIWEKKGDALGSYDSIIELTDIIANTPEDQVYQRLDETIELDQWLYAWAVHVAGGNGDVVGTNYMVVKPGDGGKWQYRAFDYSHFFGCQMLDFVDSICHPFTQDPMLYFNHFHFRVMQNEQLRNRFLMILDDALKNQLTPARVNALLETTWNKYGSDRADELALNLTGPGPYVVSANDLQEMKDYYRARHEWLLNTWIPGQGGFTAPANQHPVIRLGEPELTAGGTQINWTFSDAEGDASTVDLYWTDGKWVHQQPIAGGINVNAADGSFVWSDPPAGALNVDFFIEAVVRDGVSDLVGRDTSAAPGSPEPPTFELEFGVEQATLTIEHPNPAGTVYFTLNGSDPRGGNNQVSADAVLYTEPVTLFENTQVRARVLNVTSVGGNLWSDLTFDFLVTEPPPSLAVSEIMYNPAGGTDFEFVELFNSGNRPVNLQNIVVAGRGTMVDFTTTDVPALGPGEYAVLVQDLEVFSGRYDISRINIVAEFDVSLSNTSQSIDLTQGGLPEAFIDFRYRDSWYRTTDGGGFSLVLIDPFSSPDTWGGAEAWRPSLEINGSPGRADTLDPDINGDLSIDVADVNLVCGRIDEGDLNYDFRPDGVMNVDDLEGYLRSVLGTSLGDVDLDRAFNSDDLLEVFAAGQYDDNTAGNSTFETGDWNCDGEFNSDDLLAAFAAGAYVGNVGAEAPALNALAAAVAPVESLRRVNESDAKKQLRTTTNTSHAAQEVGLQEAAHDALFDTASHDIDWFRHDLDESPPAEHDELGDVLRTLV